MLRVGLTGGIGSGKSTVARRLVELGAHLVDADRVARAVVEPGEPALAAIADRFGPNVIADDGTLDRAALAAIAFADADQLAALESITHPAIWGRTADLMGEAEAADPTGVLVHDMPLLVEKGMTGEYHLVLVVMTDEETRVRRLVDARGLDETDARRRIRSQASDEERRAAADVLIPNDGTPGELLASVDAVWESRIRPFADNLAAGRRTGREVSTQSPPDPTWPVQADRLMARIRHAVGDAALAVEHIGSTAVPHLPAKDVIDLQVGVRSLEVADDPAFVSALAGAGFPRVPGNDHDTSHDGEHWAKRFHGSCDPGRVAHVHVREIGGQGWTWALEFRDWLRRDTVARETYADAKAELASRHTDSGAYAEAKEAWFAEVAAPGLIRDR